MGLSDYISPSRAKRKQESKAVQKGKPKPEDVELKVSSDSSQPQAPSQSSPKSSASGPSLDARNAPRPGSFYPVGDFRNSTIEEVNEIKCEVMVNWLHSQQEERLWTSGEEEEGVMLKKSRGKYTCAPADLMETTGGFFSAIQALNFRVCTLLFALFNDL